METCWRARVVPIGSAMIGTVIRRASTTDTTGGGGTRSASTLAVHPEIEREAQASARSRPARVPCLVSLTSTMIALLGKWVGAKRAAPRTRRKRPVQVRQRPGRHNRRLKYHAAGGDAL